MKEKKKQLFSFLDNINQFENEYYSDITKKLEDEEKNYLPLRSTETCIIYNDSINETLLQEQKNVESLHSDMLSARKLRNYYSKWDKINMDDNKDKKEQKNIKEQENKKTIKSSKIEELTKSNINKAIKEKEKGNDLFKKGKWKESIDCYTKSISLDPLNEIYPLNRAMAWIKLKEWDNVISDCNIGLQLNPQSVKGLYRKATGLYNKQEYNNAYDIIQYALQIEPKNKLSKILLDKIIKSKESQITKTSTLKKEDNIIKNYNKSSKSSIIEEVQPKISTIEKVKTKPKIQEIQEINSKIDKDTISLTNTEENIKQSKEKSSILDTLKPQVPLNPPNNFFEFEKNFINMKKYPDIFYQYFSIIPCNNYKTLFKNSFTEEMFLSILYILEEYYVKDEKYNEIADILINISSVGRFDMLIMFLSKSTKQRINILITNIPNKDIIKQKYKL